MTFWHAYGGIFTGLGILGTFAGLTVGLGGIDMTSDIEKLKVGIENLLTGVESAFVTSLVGIGAAIFYSILHHLLIVEFQRNIRTLTDKLDENFPRRSVEDWLEKKSRRIPKSNNFFAKHQHELISYAILFLKL